MKQLLEHTNLFNLYREYFIENNFSAIIVESFDKFEFSEKNIIYESILERISCNETLNNYPFDHFVLNCLSSDQKNSRHIINGKIPYLLSGCVAILLNEPCTMCSMALLHSRIDAVIYFKQNDVAGALGSMYQLHSMDSLNHHFSVYIAESQQQIN